MRFLTLITAFLLGFAPFQANAQGQHGMERDSHSKELVLMGGLSYYIGDLNQTGHFKYQDPAGGLGFRYNINKRFALRLSGWVGKVHASDADSDSPVQRQRNLSFESLIIEGSGQVEFNFLPFKIGTDDFFCPYIFVGLGGFHFNPQAQLGTQLVDLQPLATEGQGTIANPGTKRYSLTQVCIPFGIAVRWSLAKHIGIGLEWGIRKTFTDYIDDVSTTYGDPSLMKSPQAIALSNRTVNADPNISYIGRQRGDSKTTDWYAFSGVVISFTFPEKSIPCLGVHQ